MAKTKGIHHITAITKDAQKNLNFYEGFLGQRFVKRTVNFDDPNVYHLYYGDYVGSPGTALTFFNWSDLPPGSRGFGEACVIYYRIPVGSSSFWRDRAKAMEVSAVESNLFGEAAVKLWDPDNHIIYLVESVLLESPELVDWEESPIPKEHQLMGFYGVQLSVLSLAQIDRVLTEGLGFSVGKENGMTRFEADGVLGKYVDVVEETQLPQARQGVGSIHHVAFRAKDDEEREEYRVQLWELGLSSTGLVDRLFFHATYFMTPASILFEISTDAPGFTVNEPAEELGEKLVLPEQYEHMHADLEKTLAPLTLPRHDPK